MQKDVFKSLKYEITCPYCQYVWQPQTARRVPKSCPMCKQYLTRRGHRVLPEGYEVVLEYDTFRFDGDYWEWYRTWKEYQIGIIKWIIMNDHVRKTEAVNQNKLTMASENDFNVSERAMRPVMPISESEILSGDDYFDSSPEVIFEDDF